MENEADTRDVNVHRHHRWSAQLKPKISINSILYIFGAWFDESQSTKLAIWELPLEFFSPNHFSNRNSIRCSFIRPDLKLRIKFIALNEKMSGKMFAAQFGVWVANVMSILTLIWTWKRRLHCLLACLLVHLFVHSAAMTHFVISDWKIHSIFAGISYNQPNCLTTLKLL